MSWDAQQAVSIPLPSVPFPTVVNRVSSASFQKLLLKLREWSGDDAKVLRNSAEQTLFGLLCRCIEHEVPTTGKACFVEATGLLNLDG